MWIMTPFGILMPSALPKDIGLELGDWDLQVRSREHAALKYLKKRYMNAGTCSRIVNTPNLDYEYRVYTKKIWFADAMDEMIDDIDYEKFKPTTSRKGMGGNKLHNVYNEMWYSYFRAYSPKYEEPAKKIVRKHWWEDAK